MTKKKAKSGSTQPDAAGDEQSQGLRGKLEQLQDYFEKSKGELRKVTWPTRQETLATCGAVLVLVVVMSLFLGVVDMGLARLVKAILS